VPAAEMNFSVGSDPRTIRCTMVAMGGGGAHLGVGGGLWVALRAVAVVGVKGGRGAACGTRRARHGPTP
jgi:hypothetical protein